MRIIVLGADGYLGWPVSLYLAKRGHTVLSIDNYYKRNLTNRIGYTPLVKQQMFLGKVLDLKRKHGPKCAIHGALIDCLDNRSLGVAIKTFMPDAIIHFAEQPSAPYSMIGYNQARETMFNNLGTTLALVHAVLSEKPDTHIVKLGTMGEYGTPNHPIKEGWLDVACVKSGEVKNHRFLYPMTPGSLYHTTKVQDTHMLWMYSRVNGLTVTDIMQGPVYGYAFDDEDAKDLKSQFGTSFYYDEIFGTVINRFLVQAISDTPLTIYGGGGQIRGFLNIKDVLQCIELIVTNPPKAGEFRVINQFTQMFSIEDLASMVATAAFNIGLSPTTYQKIKNPRVELEKHPYDVEYTILEKMGLMSKPLTISILEEMLLSLLPLKDEVNKRIIQPTIQWDK